MGDLNLAIAGAGGRMGRTLVRLIDQTDGLCLTGASEAPGSPHMGADAGTLAGAGPLGIAITADPAKAMKGADGLIDFTTPDATCAHAAFAADHGLFHIIGTTGFTAEALDLIDAAARKTAIVRAGNFSVGVNLLCGLAERAARALEQDFDIEILEMHHKHKVDAPSGTALMLGEAVARGRQIDLAAHTDQPRFGQTGPRQPGQIGFTALRGGSVIGEHTVIFAGPAERIELSHKAEDRALFAHGALLAARWAQGRAPGHYSMQDVLAEAIEGQA